MLHVAIIAAAKSASVFRSLTTLKDQVSNEGSIELKGEIIGDGIRTCPRWPPPCANRWRAYGDWMVGKGKVGRSAKLSIRNPASH